MNWMVILMGIIKDYKLPESFRTFGPGVSLEASRASGIKKFVSLRHILLTNVC